MSDLGFVIVGGVVRWPNGDGCRPATAVERALWNEMERLSAALHKFGYRKHYYCEDCWYTCPKHPDGCCNDDAGDECACGADDHNALVDAVLRGEERGDE